MNLLFPSGQDPLNQPDNQWRNVIAAGSLFLLFGAFLGIQKLQSSSIQFSTALFDSFSAARQLSGKVGGDVTVVAPHLPPPALPVLKGEMLSGDTFTAKSMIVKDHKTGAVLFKKNEYDQRPIASITKLMSTLLVLERHPRWNATSTVVADDLEDSHVVSGDVFTLHDLWDAALVGSSNKAIMTLADAAGWPRPAFVERMNQKALELGMTQTTFTEPTGLDDGNISTASDIALLLSEAVAQEPIRASMVKPELNLTPVGSKKTHHMWSTDWLLLRWIPHAFSTIIGAKTGYIASSGYNFTMQAADDAGHVIDVVVLGADTHEARFTEARDVAEWVWKNYAWPE